MLMLLTLLVLGMVWVASAIVDNNKASRESLYGEKTSFLPTLSRLTFLCLEPMYLSKAAEVGTFSLRLKFQN